MRYSFLILRLANVKKKKYSKTTCGHGNSQILLVGVSNARRHLLLEHLSISTNAEIRNTMCPQDYIVRAHTLDKVLFNCFCHGLC